MEIIKKILERKWKLIHATFFFTDQEDLKFLFNDFKDYIQNTPQLEGIKKSLLTKKIIPKDFFGISSKEKSWRKNIKIYQKNKVDFNLLKKIYVFLLNEIDLEEDRTKLIKDKLDNDFQEKKADLKKNDYLGIFELPNKYLYNKESLIGNNYIDDNSLFVYHCILQGFFSVKDKIGINFIFLKPFEWTSVDFISFLLFVCKEYNLKIEKVRTIIPAIEDDYEKSDEPRQYGGAYKWILKLKEKKPNREEVKLFNKFLTDTASILDIERALIYADRIAPLYEDEESEAYLSKDIFKKILDYTSFSIILSSSSENKLRRDIEKYLELFKRDKLVRNNKHKRIGNALVHQSHNIFTYKKHNLLLREYLQKMQNDFGNNITIENKFEERFPNLEYPEAEFIRKRYEKRSFLFIHILLSFIEQGLIKISYLGNNWNFNEDRMLTYTSKVEILSKLKRNNLSQKVISSEDTENEENDKKQLKSIHLITESVAIKNTIFLVIDERFSNPVRFSVFNNEGSETYIKKLHNIAYFASEAPDKIVDYNKNLANSINNVLFTKKAILEYIKTNKLNKPTLVQKSEDKKNLVLKGDVLVETILFNKVPTQYQYLYKDKK